MAVGETDSRGHDKAYEPGGFDFRDPSSTSASRDRGYGHMDAMEMPRRAFATHGRNDSSSSAKSFASAISSHSGRGASATQLAYRPSTPSKQGTRASTAFYSVSPGPTPSALPHQRRQGPEVTPRGSFSSDSGARPEGLPNAGSEMYSPYAAPSQGHPGYGQTQPRSTHGKVPGAHVYGSSESYGIVHTNSHSETFRSPQGSAEHVTLHQSPTSQFPSSHRGASQHPAHHHHRQESNTMLSRRPNWESFQQAGPHTGPNHHTTAIAGAPQTPMPSHATAGNLAALVATPGSAETARSDHASPSTFSAPAWPHDGHFSQQPGHAPKPRGQPPQLLHDAQQHSQEKRQQRAHNYHPHDHQPSQLQNLGPSHAGLAAQGQQGRQKQGKLCVKCNLAITGQFVRALGGSYHLDCFTCADCGKPCATKFFSMEGSDGAQVPLCEHCYFKRLDLLCYRCSEALRGSYITALDRKYHVEHFTCSVCTIVFGPDDSYYEHNDEVYCHYHYWTMYAARCEGCHTAILKQFVETYRGGKEHQWHPECYMIFKFWNVKLAADLLAPPPLSSGLDSPGNESSDPETLPEALTDQQRQHGNQTHGDQQHQSFSFNGDESGRDIAPTTTSRHGRSVMVTDSERNAVLERERYIDELVLSIWTKLCGYEEVTASSVSAMLTCAVDNNYKQASIAAQQLVAYIGVLFQALDEIPRSRHVHKLGREPKTLCRKVVSYMSLLSKNRQAKERVSEEQSHELLTVASSLAHYLKVLIRYGLSSTLAIDRASSRGGNSSRLANHPTLLRFLDTMDHFHHPPVPRRVSALTSDRCMVCETPVEDKAIRLRDFLWHTDCFNDSETGQSLYKDLSTAVLVDSKLYSRNSYAQHFPGQSAEEDDHAATDFTKVSKLSQYMFLLNIAVARLELVLGQHDARDTSGKLTSVSAPSLTRPPATQAATASTSRHGSSDNLKDAKYLSSFTDARRTRQGLLDAKVGSAGNSQSEHLAAAAALERTSDMLHSKAALTLDDIRRVVASEQAREQMPNAFRHQSKAVDDMLSVPQNLAGDGEGSTFFGDLSAEDHKIVQQIAAVLLTDLVSPLYVDENDLNFMLDSKQPTIWEKMGKAFGGGPKRKAGVFGVPLEPLIERYGTDSTLGVGTYSLRIPSFVDDCLNAMKQKDMSVEGIFRKNGNIRRVREFSETIDKAPESNGIMADESAIQLAALLKKFLRAMPSPLMGAKLGKLWILVTKVDESRRLPLVRLLVCVLGRPYRDLLEVLAFFLNWVASFAHLDDESGSKMDAHNLATVITPNIFPAGNEGEPDTYLQAIESVSLLIEQHLLVARVPKLVQQILSKVKSRQGREKFSARELSEYVRSTAKALSNT